jgi:hypothetical protein
LVVFFGEVDAVGCGVVGGGVFILDFFVVARVVVVPVVAAVVVSSFFAQEAINATTASAVIKLNRDVFIGLVKLNEDRECRSRGSRASTKIV